MFNLDNPFWNAIGKICDLIFLNLMFVLCSLPIFTIGASSAALYEEAEKILHGAGGGVWREFFESFKKNFKSATLIWMILLPLGLLTVMEMYWMSEIDIQILGFLKYVFVTLFIVWVIVVSYSFPVLIHFHQSARETLKHAFLIGFYHLIPWTLIIAGLNILPWALIIGYSQLRFVLGQVMFWIGFSGIAAANLQIFDHFLWKSTDDVNGLSDQKENEAENGDANRS